MKKAICEVIAQVVFHQSICLLIFLTGYTYNQVNYYYTDSIVRVFCTLFTTADNY